VGPSSALVKLFIQHAEALCRAEYVKLQTTALHTRLIEEGRGAVRAAVVSAANAHQAGHLPQCRPEYFHNPCPYAEGNFGTYADFLQQRIRGENNVMHDSVMLLARDRADFLQANGSWRCYSCNSRMDALFDSRLPRDPRANRWREGNEVPPFCALCFGAFYCSWHCLESDRFRHQLTCFPHQVWNTGADDELASTAHTERLHRAHHRVLDGRFQIAPRRGAPLPRQQRRPQHWRHGQEDGRDYLAVPPAEFHDEPHRFWNQLQDPNGPDPNGRRPRLL